MFLQNTIAAIKAACAFSFKKNLVFSSAYIHDFDPKRLVFIFLTLTTHCALVTSHYQASFCLNNGNYTSESSYKANLNTLLASLPSNIGDSGFYNASIGEANAMVLCQADIQLSECRNWVNIAAIELQLRCPNQLQAIIWYEYCMVRYSNQPILLATEPQSAFFNPNIPASIQQFKQVRDTLMDDLRAQAADGGPLRKAAAGNRTTAANQTIYGFVQCTPDLSPENCTSCLAEASRYNPCCNNSTGFRLYMPSCVLRYEPLPFINITRLQQPPEESLPLPPPAANHNLSKSKGINQTRDIIIVVVSGVVFLALAFGVGIFARKRMTQRRKGDPNKIIGIVESLQYDFGKISAATNDFSVANKLGQGGFGAVYKGRLQDGREIAVKRLSKDSVQGDLEFKNEVLLVAKLQHRNLVRLLGFSIQGIERLLVYEFVQNGSLDHFIFDRVKSSNLDWEKRYKIIGGIARGLLYLHEDSRLRIIHRDLKASNVLLDEEMNPKISDFGLAKLVVLDATQESTSRIVGTYGYMAPEYAFHGHFSIKSDIYSFGVLVLEIVSSQKKIFLQNGKNLGNLLTYAWRSWREGTSQNIIDPVLMATTSSQQDMQRCIHIALLCVQENPDDRPTMASVVLMLNSPFLALPLPSEPGFYIPNTSSEASDFQPHQYNSNQIEPNRLSRSLLAQPINSSGNDSSITHLYPR